jgi:Spy/CpxP family protein refolding chaperone
MRSLWRAVALLTQLLTVSALSAQARPTAAASTPAATPQSATGPCASRSPGLTPPCTGLRPPPAHPGRPADSS